MHNKNKKRVIIVSISSDIGLAMAERWIKNGWDVFGTYRTYTPSLSKLSDCGTQLFYCDLSDTSSIKNACSELEKSCKLWDVLVLCPGSQNPIGAFEECIFDEWENSIHINFTSQLRIVREMLPYRETCSSIEPCVIFFAGGGTNNAVVNYSAYTISKIALIKMCELLDAEIGDTRFVILGPGWVNTKIHQSTLKAKNKAGDNYEKTKHKLATNECTSMEEVLDCCDWIIKTPRHIVSGRNFSVVFDAWGTDSLSDLLSNDQNIYKLRRSGNNLLIRRKNYEPNNNH